MTHGELHLTDQEQETYGDAVRALNEAEIPFVLSGLFSVHVYTGISRPTEDLDLLLQPDDVVAAARILADDGFEVSLEEPHWLAKARRDDHVVDLVFGMANGLWLIDDLWARRGVDSTLCGEPILVASPEDLIFHRLFITERHRFDMSDIVHLMLARGRDLDWKYLLERIGEHWRLLFAQVYFFDFSYPRRRHLIPEWVREEMRQRDSGEPVPDDGESEVCMGTLISRFSFTVDVDDWGFRDRRSETVEEARGAPAIRRIVASDVWDLARRDGRDADGTDAEPKDVDGEDRT